MKITSIVILLFISYEVISAQSVEQSHPESPVHVYMAKVREQAAIYSGKQQVSYAPTIQNTPYWVSDQPGKGVLCYDGILYPEVSMCLDLYRNELVVQYPGSFYRVVLDKERVDYAILHNDKIIYARKDKWNNMPEEGYVILLHDGTFQLIKKYKVDLEKSDSFQGQEESFRKKERYYIAKEGILFPVKNKKALLKLVSDKDKEIKSYLQKQSPDFKKQWEQALISIIAYYETLKEGL